MLRQLGVYLMMPLLLSSLVGKPKMNMDYEGQVDIYTGEPIEENSNEAGAADMVTLADGGTYDRVNHMFVYNAQGEAQSVRATVANGMMTTNAVTVTADEGLSVSLYRDGESIEGAKSEKNEGTIFPELSTPGQYSVVQKGDDMRAQIMTFTILSRKTGAVDSYPLPSGFSVTSVTFNEEKMKTFQRDTVEFPEDGEYDVLYRCRATGIDYELRVETDHEAPKITLDGVKSGVARGPVTISGLENGESLTVLRNGTEMGFRLDNVLRSVGKYEVIAQDEAGNVTKESFVIKMYLNSQSIIFFLLVVAIIASAVGYMVWSHKKLRVR